MRTSKSNACCAAPCLILLCTTVGCSDASDAFLTDPSNDARAGAAGTIEPHPAGAVAGAGGAVEPGRARGFAGIDAKDIGTGGRSSAAGGNAGDGSTHLDEGGHGAVSPLDLAGAAGEGSSPEDPDDQAVAAREHFLELMLGKWERVSDSSVFSPSHVDLEAGIELTSDGHFYLLDRDADGALVRRSGSGGEGTWEAIDTSSMNGPGVFQLNLTLGGGTVITTPAFSEADTLVRLDNMGVFVGDYHKVGATPYVAPPLESIPAPDEGACTETGSAYEPESSAIVARLLVGDWFLCSEFSLFDDAPADVAIEIVADGTFFLLYENDDGSLSRGSGFDEEGSWTLHEFGNDSGQPSFQLDVTILGRGTEYTSVTFTRGPITMQLQGMVRAPVYEKF